MATKITMHSASYIKDNFVEEDSAGSLGTDRVKFVESVIEQIPDNAEFMGTVLYPTDEPEYVAVGVKKLDGNTTYVHPSWIETINGTEIVTEKSNLIFGEQKHKMVKVNANKFLDQSGLKDISSLPICSCGSPHIVYNKNGKRLCQNCVDKATNVNNYSFKPVPQFKGNQLKADAESPVWYGLEIELGFNNKSHYEDLMLTHNETIYAKSDSSIAGGRFRVEIVSHPHSFTELMGSNSFLNDLDGMNVSTTDEAKTHNGCHIHISRTAWVDDRHYAKWYFFIHQLKTLNEFIGGRQLTGYCKFAPDGKIYNKANKSKGGDRSLMINENNENTVECRFFSGSAVTSEVKTYVQYLESLIKYTRYCGDTVTAEEWYEYVERKATKYPELLTKMRGWTGSTSQSVTYWQPIKSTQQLMDMSIKHISDIVRVQLGTQWYDVDSPYIQRDILRDVNYTFNLREITAVEIMS